MKRAIHIFVAVLLFVSVIVSIGCERIFSTKSSEVKSRLSFVVVGDPRHLTGPYYDTSKCFRDVCESVNLTGKGEFMVICGDLTPAAGADWTIDKYLGNDYVWYPVVGNHEISGDGMPWLRQYNEGGTSLTNIVNPGPVNCRETMYSFDYSNCHFAVINVYYDGASDVGSLGEITRATYNWLADDLAMTDKEHIFVAGHEPAYPQPDADTGDLRHVGSSLDRNPVSRDAFWELLKTNNVVAYFCAHTHCYSHFKKNGVWQIDVCRAREHSFSAYTWSTYCAVDVVGSNVVMNVFRRPPARTNYIPYHVVQLR